MKRITVIRITKAVGFCLAFLLLIQGYFNLSGSAVYSRGGLTTYEQLKMQFESAATRKYSCLVLGNSRIYRGVNPDCLSVPAYNFSHDNDSYNQMYWKLMYLEEENIKIDTAIIGTDYFMFGFLSESRNKHYVRFLPEGYMADYDAESTTTKTEEKIKWFEEMNNSFNEYIVKKFQQPLTYVVEAMSGEETEQRYLKSNGQYIDLRKTATEADTIKRSGKRLDIQMAYFERILEYCQEKGIKVAVVMPPTRDIEMASYTAEYLEEFDAYLEEMTDKYNAVLLNYAYDENFKALELFADSTHLKVTGADVWTQKLDEDLRAVDFY